MTIRLNEALRGRLNTLVNELVYLPALRDRVEDAYITVEPLVRGAVEAKFPQRDMKVLAKYEAAQIDDCIDLQLTAGDVKRFIFKDKTGPLVAKKTYHGQVYLADATVTDAFLEWWNAKSANDEKTKALQNDYRALIQGAKTLEEIIEIWPEAEQISQYARSQALTVLSQDVIARIRADVARRK